MTAGTNVARLPEKWRHEDPPHGYDCECDRCKTYEACAVELEAALSAHGQPEPNGKLVGWWNGITPNVLDRGPYIEPSIRWGADGEDSRHDIPLYDGYNPIHYVTPPAHGQPVVDERTIRALHLAVGLNPDKPNADALIAKVCALRAALGDTP